MSAPGVRPQWVHARYDATLYYAASNKHVLIARDQEGHELFVHGKLAGTFPSLADAKRSAERRYLAPVSTR